MSFAQRLEGRVHVKTPFFIIHVEAGPGRPYETIIIQSPGEVLMYLAELEERSWCYVYRRDNELVPCEPVFRKGVLELVCADGKDLEGYSIEAYEEDGDEE